MRVSLLNLISTPVPVLNSLGLKTRVGLSSEDPMVRRHPSEPYETFLSVYSPEGLLMDRPHIGRIDPNRRRYFDVSAIANTLVPDQDHLTVAHRVPSRLLSHVSSVEEEIEVPDQPDYFIFRSLVEYSYPGGGNGSVIYETPPTLNAGGSGHRSSNTLTFTCQIVLSRWMKTYVLIVHHSVNPSYSRIASFDFAAFSPSGDRVCTDKVSIGPFAFKVLDMEKLIPHDAVARERDPVDGLSAFTFVGYSTDAAMLIMVVNAAPDLKAVAVEHTHPPQSYVFPKDPAYQRSLKEDARRAWVSTLTSGGQDNVG